MLCRLVCVILFVGLTAERPLEFDQQLYCGLWRSPLQFLGPLFVSVPGINIWAWQIILFALAPLCLLASGPRRRSWVLDVGIAVSLTSAALATFWGWLHGGSLYQSYYQLWRFLTALLVASLLVSVVRSTRDLRSLCVTVVAAALVRGALCIYFYWAHVHGKFDPPPPHMTTHDDSLLFVAGLILMLSWAITRGSVGAWMPLVLGGPVLLYAMVLNNRRLVWIELALALATLYVLLPPSRLRRWLNLVLPIMGPVLVIYFLIGESRPGPLFAPARALSSAGSNEDASSLARQEEIRNLLYTMTEAGNPWLGTGWGMPYLKLTSVYANFGDNWSQYLYLPHNSLLGVAVYSGLVGICGLWSVVPVAAFLATRGYRESSGSVDRAAGLAAVCILPAYSAQCFGDIGLQSFTCGLILGIVMGVAGKVGAWAEASPTRRRTRGSLTPEVPGVAAGNANLPAQPASA